MGNQVIREIPIPTGATIQIVSGDITQEVVDAIVNAANSHLLHAGGVAAVISRRGGPVIQSESTDWISQNGPVSHAEPAYTCAGNLPCRFVIHAVGPVWGEGDEDRKLYNCIQGALRRAEQLKLKTIAFPAISTGIFGFPKARAAGVIFQAVGEYFAQKPGSKLIMVRIVLFDQPTQIAFISKFDSWSKSLTGNVYNG